MAVSLKQRVVDLLVESRGLDRTRLEKLLIAPRDGNKSLGQILVDEKLTSPQDLLVTLAKGLSMPVIHLSRYNVEPTLAQVVPERIARQYKVVPVSRIGNCHHEIGF